MVFASIFPAAMMAGTALPAVPPTQMISSLAQVGSELYEKGHEDDAMAMFNVATSLLQASSDQIFAVAIKHLQMGIQIIRNDNSVTDESAAMLPDHYQEDECDVGPRTLKTAVHVSATVFGSDISFVNIALNFNKALIFHGNSDLLTARELYSSVLQTMQNTSFAQRLGMPSQQLLELGTRCHNNMGHICYLSGEEDLARAHFEASLLCARQLSELTIKDYRGEYVTVLSNWCRVTWMRGDLGESFFHGLREVLRLRTALLSWDHVDVAAAHYNIAVAEYARHKSPKAVSHLMQYLHIASHRESNGHKDLDRIPALIHLLMIQHEAKDDAMSQELLRGLRTLQDKRQDQGPESPEVASVLNFVGTILFHKEDFKNALIFFQEELRLEDRLTDSMEDISVSVTCNNIGRILQELGKLNEAIEYYQRALHAEYGDISQDWLTKGLKECQVFRTGKTKSHPSSANLYSTVWYNLGLIYDKLGSHGAAIGAFEMSLVFRKSMLGADHPDIACLLYNIGVLQMEQQKLNEASISFREALRIRHQGSAGQLNDKHVIKTLEKLSSLHKAKGNIKGALEASREVLRIQEASIDYTYSTKMREVGCTLRSIAELYHANGDLEPALEMAIASTERLRLVADVERLNVLLDPIDRHANIEQLVTSLLLVGSLYHEMCDPIRAFSVHQEAATAIQSLTSQLDAPTSLKALCEVACMLERAQCAASA